jgi:uncharacterized protein DUF6230
MGDRVLGKTRWRWFAVPFLPAVAAVGVMMFLVASGVLALNLSISGIPFTLTASTLSGTGFVQYAEPDATGGALNQGVNPFIDTSAPFDTIGQHAESDLRGLGGAVYAADTVTKFSTASIADLKQWVCVPNPLYAAFGNHGAPYFIAVTEAGGGNTSVSASSLTVYAPGLQASTATFTNINIGQDIGKIGGGAANGMFSQYADSATISNVKQVGLGTTAGSFTLPGLTAYAAFANACP